MTSQLEIGYMIIQAAKTDAVLQSRPQDNLTSNNPRDALWHNVGSEEPINTSTYEYRLKEVPKIKYYRAYIDAAGEERLASSSTSFTDWSFISGAYDRHKVIHDFKIEQE